MKNFKISIFCLFFLGFSIVNVNAMQRGYVNLNGMCINRGCLVLSNGEIFIDGQPVSMEDLNANLGEVTRQDRSNFLAEAENRVFGIKLNNMGKVFLHQGETESLVIEANEKILPKLITRVNRGILELGLESISFIGNITLNYYITLRDIRMISCGNYGEIISDGIVANDLRIALANSGKLNISNDCNIRGPLNIEISNYGEMSANNIVANDLRLHLTGSSKLNIFNHCNIRGPLNIDISNYGECRILRLISNENCIETGSLNINGSGNLSIGGNPSFGNLSINVNNYGELCISNFAASMLNVSITGSAKVSARGGDASACAVDNQRVGVSNYGEYNAEDLFCNDSTVHVSGSAKAFISTQNLRNYSVSNYGTLTSNGRVFSRE
ncbi:MAG: DUF2807 domain-containing protein [Candidatus Babeliales bacterium]